jgi:glucose-1-phosphate thymidylyltransferase
VVIGANVNLEDSYVGPYTAVGEGARIECAEIENSIMFPGAVVLRVAARLESCVVGSGARVERCFSVPRGVRLNIGDGSTVLLG